MRRDGEELFRPEASSTRSDGLEGEIILSQPFRAHLLAAIIFIIICCAATFASFATYSRTEKVHGLLVTDRVAAKVVAVQPGRVAKLLVTDGQRVTAGQPLAVIHLDRERESGGGAAEGGLAAVDAQRRMAGEQAGIVASRAEGERARLNATLSGLDRQQERLARQLALQREVVASAGSTFEGVSSLVEKGYVSRVEVERRRQFWLTAKQQVEQLEQQLAESGAAKALAEAEHERLKATAAGDQLAARQLGQSLLQQRAQLERERAYVIPAPATGQVSALQVSFGQTVDPSLPLMTIVPEHSKLHAALYAPTKAVGFVRPGQEVRLLYDAFPYQRFGSFRGRVTRMSNNVLDPREVAAPLRLEEPVYRIDVAPDSQTVAAYGEVLVLQPGMTLTATLVLDRQSLLDWFLTPMRAVINRDG
jgi:membrane fusion protein